MSIGFLTTALEIIIILDICGAMVYVALSGLNRSRGNDGGTRERTVPLPTSPLFPYNLHPAPAGAPQALTDSSNLGAVGPYPDAGPATGTRFWSTASNKIRSFGRFCSFRRTPMQQGPVRGYVENDRQRLNQVLNSFKEEI